MPDVEGHRTPGSNAADSELSLHQRIVNDIGGRILSGALQPGHRIPGENEIAASYGCSRMTVNKALSELARTGLIERRRRSGSQVSRPRSHAVLEIQDIRSEVEALGLTYGYELLSRRVSAAEAAELPAFPGGTRLLHLVCRHFSGSVPFCLEQRTISLASVPLAEEAGFEAIAPGPWLLARTPWSSAEHRICAVSADSETAGILGTADAAACLVIERRTWRAGEPVTWVRLTYPGNSHSLVARFTPQAGQTGAAS